MANAALARRVATRISWTYSMSSPWRTPASASSIFINSCRHTTRPASAMLWAGRMPNSGSALPAGWVLISHSPWADLLWPTGVKPDWAARVSATAWNWARASSPLC